VLAGLTITAAEAGDVILFDFDKGFDFANVPGRDVTVSEAKRNKGSALRITTSHNQPWPGIDLLPPKGSWDLSGCGHVALDVTNVGAKAVTVYCRVDNPGADGVHNCITGCVSVKPGETTTLEVALKHRAGPAVNLFGMRGYPPPEETGAGAIDTAHVTGLVVFVTRPSEDYQDYEFEIDNVRGGGTPEAQITPEAARTFFPLIDTFGQYIHREWPGKVHSAEELRGRVAEENADLARKPGPPEWDKWGGYEKGPKLNATGFFRVEKYEGKWWLVDPDGHLFWSNGIDCVNMLDSTPVSERETWFQDFPGARPELAEFSSTVDWVLMGYYRGKKTQIFCFAGANRKRKFGDDWRRQSDDLAHRRLRSWGVNTIGNWSDGNCCLLRRTPYVACVGFDAKNIEGSSGYWGKFKDPFDPGFREGVRKAMAAQAGTTAGDPWCLGYFVDNEITWGDETSLAVAALLSPPEQAAKKVFVDDLKAKYGTIEALNAAWGTSHASWDALLKHQGEPDRAKAGADLKAFYTRIAEEYFRVIHEAVKEVAPNNLYLGCRFAWGNSPATQAAAKYCDVVSFNLYCKSVAEYYCGLRDVPLIIGEFHFGALDRGMFHTGLVPVAGQAARAAAYQEYVRGALRHPQIVGCHWFQYQDEPTTGRFFDEENYQIGFVDCADTAYRETVDAARKVGWGMYEYRLAAK
jgi:hypothetical protein